jgi:hypothetical protein
LEVWVVAPPDSLILILNPTLCERGRTAAGEVVTITYPCDEILVYLESGMDTARAEFRALLDTLDAYVKTWSTGPRSAKLRLRTGDVHQAVAVADAWPGVVYARLPAATLGSLNAQIDPITVGDSTQIVVWGGWREWLHLKGDSVAVQYIQPNGTVLESRRVVDH